MSVLREGLHAGRGPEETHADPHRGETLQLQGVREELPGQTLTQRTPQRPWHGGGGAGARPDLRTTARWFLLGLHPVVEVRPGTHVRDS